MSTITFDTLKVSKRLREAGYTEQQADVFAEVQKETFAEAMETTLATKDDIRRLEMELVVMKWMLGVIMGGIVALLIKSFI
jgi:protein-L-isoaspartate O-methyltransferase